MSYQSVKTPRARDNTSTKLLLVSASILSVVAFIALKNLVWFTPPPAKKTPPDEPALPAPGVAGQPQPSDAEADQTAIDPASLSDASALPSPPVQVNPPGNPDATTPGLIEIPPQSLGSPAAIGALFAQLKIAAVTENKAIINGLLFEAGDFIDAGRQLKLVSQKQGNLIFEINGVPFTHKLK